MGMEHGTFTDTLAIRNNYVYYFPPNKNEYIQIKLEDGEVSKRNQDTGTIRLIGHIPVSAVLSISVMGGICGGFVDQLE